MHIVSLKKFLERIFSCLTNIPHFLSKFLAISDFYFIFIIFWLTHYSLLFLKQNLCNIK